MQANLTNRDATRGSAPVREVELRAAARAGRSGRARARRSTTRRCRRRARRSSRSRWTTGAVEIDAGRRRATRSSARSTGRAVAPIPRRSRALAARLERGAEPGAGRRARHRRERRLGRRRSRSPSAAALPVWASPAPAAGASASPRATPTSRASLPPAIGPVGQTLEEHDLVLVAGSSVFPYYPYIPGAAAPRGRRAGRDHERPRRGRARADGRRDRRRRRADAARRCSARSASPTARRRSRWRRRRRSRTRDPLEPLGAVHATLAEVLPDDGIVVLESPVEHARAAQPAADLAAGQLLLLRRRRARLRPRGRRSACSSLSPSRPVVCVLGEGSAQYAITGFWTAAAYKVPGHVPGPAQRASTRSSSGSPSSSRSTGAPGLDLPALDDRRDRTRLRRRRRAACAGRDELRAALASGARRQRAAAGRGRRRRPGCPLF